MDQYGAFLKIRQGIQYLADLFLGGFKGPYFY